jgi:lia operon protein LiaG
VVDIRTTSGKVTGQYLSGSVSVALTSGFTDISNLYGDIRVKSQSGDIKIQQESGSLELFTRTGSVDVQTEIDSTRDYYVETSSGRISFNVPETASGAVKLETVSGSINTELPLAIRQFTKSKLVGDFGENGPRIYLMTASGDITLGQF